MFGPENAIVCPFEVPAVGTPVEVAPDIFWVRLPLPFRLNHVNIYLIRDGAGWAVFDTGINTAASRAAWKLVLPMLEPGGISRVIATHFHSDHVGLAGWLTERFDAPLYMSHAEYLTTVNWQIDPGDLSAALHREFYRSHGLDADTTELVLTKGLRYVDLVHPLPRTFRRLGLEETLRIGDREFQVLTAAGHSVDQVIIYCRKEKLLLCADQVLARISPNVSVSPLEPDGDPLGAYLRSLDSLKEAVDLDALVLPGHDVPFRGLHARIDELKSHHEERCAVIAEHCRRSAKSTAEIVPLIFHGLLDPQQLGFAFSEALAHVNYMLRRGVLEVASGASGVSKAITRATHEPGSGRRFERTAAEALVQ